MEYGYPIRYLIPVCEFCEVSAYHSLELTSHDHEMKPSYCRPETNGLVLVMIVLWIVRLQHKTVLITLLKHAVIQPSKALICSSTERHPRYLNPVKNRRQQSQSVRAPAMGPISRVAGPIHLMTDDGPVIMLKHEHFCSRCR